MLHPPREAFKNGAIGMLSKNHGDLPIKLRNAGQQRPQLRNQGLHHQGTGFQYRFVLGQRASILDLFQLFIQIQPRSRMPGVELPDLPPAAGLQTLQCRPLLKKITCPCGIQSSHPCQGLRIVSLQQSRQLIRQRCRLVHQIPSTLRQQTQTPRHHIIWPPSPESTRVLSHHVAHQFRIHRIARGATAVKRFSKTAQRFRIDDVQH